MLVAKKNLEFGASDVWDEKENKRWSNCNPASA